MKKMTIFYKKLIISYNVVILGFIFVINLVLFKNIEQKDDSYNEKINRRMINNVSQIFYDIETFLTSFLFDLYNDNNILNDTIYFLNNDLNIYLENKLDKFYESKNSYYKGIEFLIRNCFIRNNSIKNIELISYKKNKVYSFDRQNKIKEEYFNNIETNKDFWESRKSEIIYIKKINNPLNLEQEGLILFKIDKSSIDKVVKEYDEYFTTLILKKNSTILYSSKENYNENEIVLLDIIDILNTNKSNISAVELPNDIIILGIIENIPLIVKYKKIIIYAIIINVIFFIISEMVIFKRLKKLNNRLNIILDTMQDINIDNKLNRIPKEVENEKDEITIICKKFNSMCDNLEEYINKYYISKINEKNAEMKILQSSINPHFLYNTLEAIRMKAIINNDKEVAKMIYMLAHLFRSQLKEKDIITIKSELEYCNKFLEIYKFRYNNKILYSVECDEKLLEQEIIKFILQPLIENYFIHGIRLEDNNNKISINIKYIDNLINITIEDNGKGISKQKLNDLKNKIELKENDTQMIGILNVNQRIKIKYGDNYGLNIESNIGKGTKITIKLPYIKER